jgi:hypothetical protein
MSEENKAIIKLQIIDYTILTVLYGCAIPMVAYVYLVKRILKLEKMEFHIHMFVYCQAYFLFALVSDICGYLVLKHHLSYLDSQDQEDKETSVVFFKWQ